MMVLNIWQAGDIPKADCVAENCSKWEAWIWEGKGRSHPSCCMSTDKSEQELTKLHASNGNQQKRQKQLHLAQTLVSWSLGCHHSSPVALMAHGLVACHIPILTPNPILLEERVWLSYKQIKWVTKQAPPPAMPSSLFMFLGEENEVLYSGQLVRFV